MNRMTLHPRVSIFYEASLKFSDLWHKVVKKMDRKTFEEGYLVLNQIDRFWIECAMREISVQDACLEWGNADYSVFALASATEQTGHDLAKLVSDYDLTYGEIVSILIGIRNGELKSHIRSERNLD